MNWSDDWPLVALFCGGAGVILLIIGSVMMTDYYVAHSPTPIETACALGRRDACLMMVRP